MVDAIIERVQTSNTKSARATVTLSFAMGGHGELFMELAEQTGNAMRVTFEAIATQLGLGDDVNAGVPPTTERVWETPSGDVVRAHAYEGSDLPDGTCALCGYATSHESHDEKHRLAALGDKLIADVETEHREPSDDREAMAQQEASMALAGRSRGNRK